ncbi:MAG: protein kinase [Pseudomonadota bacterium]
MTDSKDSPLLPPSPSSQSDDDKTRVVSSRAPGRPGDGVIKERSVTTAAKEALVKKELINQTVLKEKSVKEDDLKKTVVKQRLVEDSSVKNSAARDVAAKGQSEKERLEKGTRIAERPHKIVPAAPLPSEPSVASTQYANISHSQHTSSGFAEAQSIAQQAQAGSGSGSLLKKRFLLEKVLGEGGMGTVYKTKDLRKVEAEDPNPYIATKVLNQAFKDHPNAFVTLQQEAAKSHTLAHPNIVTVHDFDRDGDTLFMTMELLEGEPLDHLIKAQLQKGLAKEKALSIVRDMCTALAYAHQRHIIHADFKPGNVFVSQDGTAKVLDFGIARAASKETQKHKFDAGQLGALTPAYATIEMVNGDALTFSDDVYALACVTYEILTGRHPYKSKSALEAKQLGLKLVPAECLSKKEWKALSHALALDKNLRTATVSEFIGELFPRRRSAALIAAIVLLMVALGGVAWFANSQQKEKLKIKNTIAENIDQAQTCFAQSDFSCAIERGLVAVNLDATNKVATQLVAAAQLAQQKQKDIQRIASLLSDGENCLSAGDDACAQVKAREVLSLERNSLPAQQLLTAANNLQQNKKILDYVQQADVCLQNGDVACAEMFAKQSADVNPANVNVIELQQKLQARQEQTNLAVMARQQKITTQLQLAQNCLQQKKYDCAIQQANAALTLDAANSRAMEIKQTATAEAQQGRDAEGKVEKILAQAEDCLDKKKNYSCAIAKAEAALDLMPNNPAAIAIKTRAQETQRKIKETGFTIK